MGWKIKESKMLMSLWADLKSPRGLLFWQENFNSLQFVSRFMRSYCLSQNADWPQSTLSCNHHILPCEQFHWRKLINYSLLVLHVSHHWHLCVYETSSCLWKTTVCRFTKQLWLQVMLSLQSYLCIYCGVHKYLNRPQWIWNEKLRAVNMLWCPRDPVTNQALKLSIWWNFVQIHGIFVRHGAHSRGE